MPIGEKLIPQKILVFPQLKQKRWCLEFIGREMIIGRRLAKRVMHVHDLPAAEATYYQCFSVYFRTKLKAGPIGQDAYQIENKKKNKHSHRGYTVRRICFLKVVQYLVENKLQYII